MDKDYLLLKRAAASRPSGEWNDDDYDVLADGAVVGRIVGLRALGLGARVIDVLDREIQLVLVPFGIATELAAAVGQHAQQLDIVLLEERQHTVIEQIGRRDRRLAVVELGKADLGVGVDEGLLVDASNTLQVADVDPRR